MRRDGDSQQRHYVHFDNSVPRLYLLKFTALSVLQPGDSNYNHYDDRWHFLHRDLYSAVALSAASVEDRVASVATFGMATVLERSCV